MESERFWLPPYPVTFGSSHAHIKLPNGIVKTPPKYLLEIFSKMTELRDFEGHAGDLVSNRKLSLSSQARLFLNSIRDRGKFYAGPGALKRMLCEALVDLSDEGYFVFERDLETLKKLYAADSAELRAPLRTLGIVTRNRPASAKSCYESYTEHARRFDWDLQTYLCDDSDIPLTQEGLGLENEENLIVINRESQKKIRHELKRNFDAKLIDFLFQAHPTFSSYGVNRNFLLLLSAGRTCLSVDDDTLALPQKSYAEKHSLKFDVASSYAQEINPLMSFDEAILKSDESINIFALQSEIIGKSLVECLDVFEASYNGMSPQSWSQIQKGHGKVRLSFFGLRGDSGSGHSLGPMALSLKNKDMLKSADVYSQCKESRFVHKFSRNCNLSQPRSGMTTFYAFDNSELCPPFFPYFRLEDSVFVQLMNQLYPEDRSAYLPCSLVHQPMEKRTILSQSLAVPMLVGVPDIVSQLLVRYEKSLFRDDRESTMFRFAKWAVDYLNKGAEDLIDECIDKALTDKIRDLDFYRLILKSNKSYPSFWKEDLMKIISQMEESLKLPVLVGEGEMFIAGKNATQAKMLTVEYLKMYFQSLQLWSEILREFSSVHNEMRQY